MQITANQVLNDKSKIMAGGALTANIGTLTNSEVAGTRTTTDTGIANYFFRIREKGRDSGGVSITSYNPAANLLAISLAPTSFLQNTAPSASGTSIAARTMHSVNQAAGAANVTNPSINLISPNISIPDNNLFRYNPDPKAHYLIETDPQFANYRTWLSSNYLLSALAYNPALTTARLGDGFYEQKLVREQIAQLTGRRFLTGYTNDEAQYQALMQNGITVAKTFKLTPGVALTASQVAQLTSDIVWLVQQTITLADGSTTQALVPQVYVRTKAGDLSGNGALISADTTNLHVAGDLNNTNGTIAGRTVLALNAYNVNNLGGRLTANDVSVAASNDLNNLGGQIDATNSLVATAGHDLNVISTTSTQTSSQGSRTNINRMAGLYVTGNPTLPTTGLLVASSGHDIHLDAAQIVNIGADNTTGETAIGGTSIQAAHDLSLGSVTTSEQNNIVWNSTNHLNQGSTLDNGTTIQTNGNIQLQAGNDANIKAASVTSGDGSATNAGGSLNVVAGNSINLTAGQATQNLDETAQVKSHGFLSSTTTKLHDTINKSDSIGSSLSADSITLQAGGQNAAKGDININGSNVVATQDTTLNAANNITITAAQNTDDETHLRDVKKSGLLSSGGIGFTIGSRQLTNTNDTKSVTNTASTVGSIAGNVNINAGLGGQTGMYTQTGSDVLAPKGDVNITAQQVDINAATNSNNSVQTTKFKQTGITLAVTSPVISAIQTAQQMVQAASQTKDTRMQALAAGTTALSASNALDAIKAGQGSDMFGKTAQIATTDANGKPSSRDANAANQVGGINISISLGTSQNSSTTTQTSDNAQSSHVTAGNNIHIKATGDQLADDSSNPDSGNIYVIGSQVKANHNVSLDAQNNLNLHAAQNVDTLNSKNSGSSASLGVSFGTDGLLFTAGLSGSKGKAKGNDISYTETQIQSGNKAGESVTLTSGKDTNLIGAQVSGNQVIANVGTNPLTGGNLNIQSLQDLSDFNSKQQSIGSSISVGYGKMGGSFNYSDSKTNSHYASVNEQSGMMAGDGGFQVKVNGNTNLTGAVMASTDKAIQDNKNSLTTQTLTTSNIQNSAEYSAKGVSFGTGVGLNKQSNGSYKNAPTASAGMTREAGNADSVTLSGISGGAITITDNHQQTGMTGKDAVTTLATLNRDVKINGNGEVVDSQGNSTAHTITPIFDQRLVAQTMQAQMQITQAFSQVAPKAVADFAQSQYDNLKTTNPAEAEKWAEGGLYRIALHTALGGLISGDISGVASAGAIASAAPLLNDLQAAVQKQLEGAGLSTTTANTVSQILVELTSIGIGGAIGGANGAATALVVDTNNRQLHWDGFLKEKAKCDKSPSNQGCGTIEKMAGDSTRVIPNAISGLPESMVIANLDAQGNVVSYTVADKLGHPQLIMQPLEFEVYRNATLGIRANMNLAPQWSLDYASALVYSSTGQIGLAVEHAGLVLTNPGMWMENAVGVLGGVLAGSEIKAANSGAAAVDTSLVASGKAIGQFDMVTNPGPLASMPGTPASNFSGGKYTALTLTEDITLYRGGDSTGKALGQWFTTESPTSVAQVRIDTAVKPQWVDPKTGQLTGNSPIDVVYTVKIPAGTTIYQGSVGNQGGVYVGGHNVSQVFVPEPWKIPGVQIIGQPKLLK
ncbi:MAG: hypothetical protein HOP04_00270 [Methylophilaceae bacterium]|nr:hypothetical protein [Methylophilaceae bacterium]